MYRNYRVIYDSKMMINVTPSEVANGSMHPFTAYCDDDPVDSLDLRLILKHQMCGHNMRCVTERDRD
jgi:hypothetical protein